MTCDETRDVVTSATLKQNTHLTKERPRIIPIRLPIQYCDSLRSIVGHKPQAVSDACVDEPALHEGIGKQHRRLDSFILEI